MFTTFFPVLNIFQFIPAEPCGCDYHNIVSGTLTSPNYPSPYNMNQVCTWVLTSRAGTTGTISITIDDFEFEVHDTCAYDVLQVDLYQCKHIHKPTFH